MQSAKKMKALSVLSMAVAATLGAKAAHGATLTLYYDNINDLTPALSVAQSFGYGVSSDPTAIPTTINIGVGDTLTIGVDAVVTNNLNTDGGKLTGTISGTKKTQFTQPSFLGLSTMSVVVPSTDNSASLLTPNLSSAPFATFGTAPDYQSTASINGVTGGSAFGPNNTIASSNTPLPVWADSTQGDAAPTSTTGGDVGDHFAIFGGNGAESSNSKAGAAAIAQYGAATASYGTATDFFDSLSYTATAVGTVTLSPAAHAAGTSYWELTQAGSASVVSGYIASTFTNPGDVIGTLPVLVINITSGSTTTVTNPIISLTAASGGAPTAYGSKDATLTVVGGHGSYGVSQATGLTGSTGYVEADGFNPATDEEIYALDVLVNGIQANASQITALITEIDGGGAVKGSTGVQAASSYTGLPTVTDSNDPFGSQYNLFLDASAPPSGDNFFGFNVASSNDSNLVGYTVSAVAVVPEPMSLGLLALGSLGLMTRRNRRKV